MITGFGNNVVSSLAADITANQTTIQVMPGSGAKFAALLSYDYDNSSNALKTYAKLTLTDDKQTAFEVCHLTAVDGDILTVVRGQEGTTAKGWVLRDVIANFATRGSENQFVQIEQLQSGHYTSAVAGGTANALAIDLPATYFVNGSTDWMLRTPVIVYPTQGNTGASTLQLVMGGRVLGTFPLYKGNKAQLVAGDIIKDVALVCMLDKSQTFFSVMNPGAIYAGLGTAAFKDIVTSMTDTTAERVPVVGWMGAGGPEIPIPDGTDIYKYFATAASGNYGGGGNLVNKVTSSGWVSFKWQQHGSDKRYGVLFEQSSGGKMALHIYNNLNGDMTSPEKYWSNSGLLFSEKNPPTAAQAGALPITGGKLTGNLEINDNAPIIQFSEADTGKKYFIVVDGSGLRIDEDSTAGNSILSYAGASKQMKTVGQFVPTDYGNFDSRYLKLTGGTLTGNLTVQSTIQVGGIGSGVLNIGDNDSGLRSSKDGQVDLWANSKMMGYWNTTTFSFTGQIVPTDYTNFDSRYGGKNSASKADNGWFKDASTGLIFQWGKVASSSPTNVNVTFPIAFPSKCVSVQNTIIRPNNNGGANNWTYVTSLSATGASIGTDSYGAYWFAIGY
ncbi:hypothetical protein M942_22525 [Enterobacter ludwigii]|jgi:hypothetical protein|uniref:gp53-like domain-containing protein n=1 Tax=Enterobacter ludwigii TaxID=299767 RepID=UPI0003D8DEE2|nr:hypothetical protein [Enterobacter ludwigii]AHE73394.1 hypothetical protein M942_22525 [Enterobacter ludwigii]